MKGILIEKRLRKSVVMDQNGKFIKTKTNKSWNEGDEVNFVSTSVKVARSLSVAAVFVLVFAIGLFAIYASNSYIVHLDVNPSIEIKVGAFNNVTEIRALNDDASEIEEGLSNLVGMKFGTAVNVAVQVLLDEGYLEEDGTVVLSVEGKNGKLRVVEKLVSEALAGVEIETEDDEDDDLDVDALEAEGADGEPKLKVYIGRVTEEMATAAQELNVPIGRMVLVTKAREESFDFITDDMADVMVAVLSVQEIQRVRNLYKTINKATELIEGESEKGNGNMKQIESIVDKIIREISKIEGNLAELQAMIDTGEADDDIIERYDVLNQQLIDLAAKLEEVIDAADIETEEVLNGMAGYKDATPKEKARIREEIKEAKKAEIDAKQEENRTRVEEKMDEVKAKVAALKAAKNKSEEEGPENAGDNAGENAGENSSDNSPGNSGSNAGDNAGNNAGGNGN
ncbi:MAG: hypothetical protein KAH14_09975 [Clostridiales bacterium]|nr:hypothetical protein [Clostridiales bacterium]